ncbi:sugar transporter [Microbulbifer rhizosphaerae]|uniref:Capsular polysaccharide transport system permease protein n=1 Tax=Microbulbifer rhizosphaerae TaxID=1562603 RepID=A0A7W4WDU9_9GAMM|nr:sugar transporter [Microbulbifer rhizosphaerae]MBB3061897.1 capsular polysaccharide transport system permease protein [Microbulbifer rhizosphaerae]
MESNDALAVERKADSTALKKASRAVRGVMARLAANEPQAEQGALRTGLGRWSGLALCVALPLLLVSAYYLLWVSDRYVSSTQLIVKDNGSSQGMSSTLGFLVPGMGADSQDAFLVVNYVQSLDMALYLNDKLDLVDYYKSDRYDVFSRLAQDASQEDYLEYYREHIAVGHDEQTGIITIEMQAFEPEFARQLIETVTQKSEDFVNAISNQLADKQVAFVRSELELAQSKLRTSKQEILDFQNRNNVVSPEELTKGISSIIQGLEVKLAEQRAKLTAAKTYLNPGSSQIVSMQAEIDALGSQIAAEKVRLVGVSNDQGEQRLNSLSAHFQNLELELQFAVDAYQASLKALETARMEASGRLKHLMVVSQPSLAEEAEYPRKLYNLASLAVILLLLYGIGKMLLASIRDHRI